MKPIKLALESIILFYLIDNQRINIEFSDMKLQNEIMHFRRCFIYNFKIL
jgi:hypothetical protein